MAGEYERTEAAGAKSLCLRGARSGLFCLSLSGALLLARPAPSKDSEQALR